jgi:hypothetical protein
LVSRTACIGRFAGTALRPHGFHLFIDLIHRHLLDASLMDFLCDIQKSAKRFTTDGIPEEPVEGGGRQQAGFARGSISIVVIKVTFR